MYVLEYTATAAVSGVAAAGDIVFLPADMCSFRTVNDSNGGYIVSDSLAKLYSGENSEGINLNVATNLMTLGYIAKTGRFVPITNTVTFT